jgi:hypothetical protein
MTIKNSGYCLLRFDIVWFGRILHSYPEDGEKNMSLRNVDTYSPDYTESHAIRQKSSALLDLCLNQYCVVADLQSLWSSCSHCFSRTFALRRLEMSSGVAPAPPNNKASNEKCSYFNVTVKFLC